MSGRTTFENYTSTTEPPAGYFAPNLLRNAIGVVCENTVRTRGHADEPEIHDDERADARSLLEELGLVPFYE